MICPTCRGQGLVDSPFCPDSQYPKVTRNEKLRCPDCGGLGQQKHASKQD